MAIRKIVSRSITDGAITTSDLAAGSLSSAGLDITGAGGTGSALLPKGTTAQRPESAVIGYIRYNTTTDCYEQYTSLGWAGIAAPPSITSITPTTYNGESGTTITINGANFDAGSIVTFITNGGTAVDAGATTFISTTQLTATTPQDFTVADEPLDIKVTKTNGLSITYADALDCGGSPSWSTSSGSLGTYYDSQRSTVSLSVSATDPDTSATVTYSIVSGSLPSGMSLNSSTGALSGTPNAVGSDTTSSFTVRATDNAGNTADRSFSITIKAPVITTYTSVGSGTFSVPSGVSSVWAVVVAGGGPGQLEHSGGGGAGGMIEMPSFPVTPGGSVSYTLGAGGPASAVSISGSDGAQPYNSSNGSDSVFGTLTAKGGGRAGGYYPGSPSSNGQPGGSGGGAGYYGTTNVGTGTQPSQPGNSGTYGYGFPGGADNNVPLLHGGGGGGAGAAGEASQPSRGGNGGTGRSTSISGSPVYYAGGGGGSGGYPAGGPGYRGGTGGTGGGGEGGGCRTPGSSPTYNANGVSGTTNTGGGGGGATNNDGPGLTAGSGAPGIIIVRY